MLQQIGIDSESSYLFRNNCSLPCCVRTAPEYCREIGYYVSWNNCQTLFYTEEFHHVLTLLKAKVEYINWHTRSLAVPSSFIMFYLIFLFLKLRDPLVEYIFLFIITPIWHNWNIDLFFLLNIFFINSSFFLSQTIISQPSLISWYITLGRGRLEIEKLEIKRFGHQIAHKIARL